MGASALHVFTMLCGEILAAAPRPRKSARSGAPRFSSLPTLCDARYTYPLEMWANPFSFCSPENKFFDGGLAGGISWGFLASWGVYWLVIGGTTSPTRSIGIKILAGFFCQSIEPKRLRGNVLIALDLGRLPLLVRAPGWAVLLPRGAGPPFRPDQKVKLDKSEAGRGVFSCVLASWR